MASLGAFLPTISAYADAPALGADDTTLASSDPSIRAFNFRASDAALADLHRRIGATKWPSRELVADASQGVQLSTTRELARYWQSDYDWRNFETRLSALPQFMTTIDVVIPSLPGHGFSGTPTVLGWDPVRIARAWVVLMKRLGYTRYVAQGGDWGNAVTEQMALLRPPELLGIHTNMPATIPDEIAKSLQAGGPPPSGLSPDERYAYDQLDFFYKHGLAYAQEMSNRPQTLYGIEDSPVGLAAWMLDHDARSYALIARVFSGQPEGLTRDDILDNITLYWLTNTAVSSARLYWESKLAFFAPKGVRIPVAVSAFPDEIYTAPRSWTESAYPRLVHYNRLAKGGHFAAWEQPQAFSEELRASFRSLR
jgi:pimeloyl-ACP methyl ester carboxylesterase